jgi:hypothetical protein
MKHRFKGHAGNPSQTALFQITDTARNAGLAPNPPRVKTSERPAIGTVPASQFHHASHCQRRRGVDRPGATQSKPLIQSTDPTITINTARCLP